jgi:malonate decarboxylase delta subunit
MERLEFDFPGKAARAAPPRAWALAGVLSSGNLEVLIEHVPLEGACAVAVSTSAIGFGDVWRAVLADFFARHPLADVRVSINDAGATPAVVSLRLDQAAEEFAGGRLDHA